MTVDRVKQGLRSRLRRARRQVVDVEARSGRVLRRLQLIEEYRAAMSVAFYVAIGQEVRTTASIERALADASKRISVPNVAGDALHLFQILSLGELQPGTFGVPEPNESIRNRPARRVAPNRVDLFVVPGLGFDEGGGRIGYGRGFFDRLLQLAPQAIRIGLAFECQMVPKVPMTDQDRPMDFVVTENRTIDCAS